MSADSKIEWTNATWNPVTGCTKVSPGCDHCYAERLTERFHGKGSFAEVVLHPERLDAPLRWRKPRMVFVNSMSDLFHKDVPDEFIARVFAVMAESPRHTFQVLTKRHGRMRSLLSRPDWPKMVEDAACDLPDLGVPLLIDHLWTMRRPLPNVWLGVSVEDQKHADLRIPALLETPAAVRFLSCEPLIGPVDLGEWFVPHGSVDCSRVGCSGLGWVIVGGESGPGARPMHPDWARSLRDQCQTAGVPYFFKQWGEHRWVAGSRYDDETRCWVDDGVEPQRVGKKAAGRELDGRTWDEFPVVAS